MKLTDVFANNISKIKVSENSEFWADYWYSAITDESDPIEALIEYASEKGYSKSKIAAVITALKTEIIRNLLESMKEGYNELVGNDLVLLKKLGLDWPELGIIEKSIRADTSIAEDSQEVGYPASEIIDRIRATTDRSILAIYHGLQAMSYEGIGPRAQNQIIEPYGKEISDYWDEMLSNNPRNPKVIEQGLKLLSIGIRWPELRAALEKNKGSILWYILSRVKDSVEQNTYVGRLVAKTVIESLRDIGVNWPEFNSILKSIDTPKRVAENDEASDISNEVYYMLQRSVERMDIWYVLSRMIEWKLNFKKIPQARELFDTRKDFIVKELLRGVKTGETGYSNRRISSLHHIGVDWPELDIIQKSILADREKRASIAEEDDEPGSQEDFIKHSVSKLFKNNNPGAALNIIYAHYKSDPRNIEWLRKNITPVLLKHYNKKKLLQWVANSVDAVTMPRIVSARNLLTHLGVELPDIKTIIDDNKDHIMKRLLQLVRNYQSADPVIKDIQHLRELGITWSELDVIEKSHLSDKTIEPLDEERSLSEIYELYMLDAIKRKDSTAAVDNFNNLFSRFNSVLTAIYSVRKLPLENQKWFFELIKKDIIVDLLDSIKSDHYGDIDDVKTIIRMLKKAKIYWPELDIIVKSLRADKRLNEQQIKVTGENFIEMSRELVDAVNNRDQDRATNIFMAFSSFWMMYQVLYFIAMHVDSKSHAVWFFNLQKTAIMKHLLEEIKEASDSGYPQQILSLLLKLKLDWPELAVIKRSLQADKKLDEDNDSTAHSEWQIQRVLDEIDVQLSNGYPSFITWVYQLKHLDALPRVKPIIEKYGKNVVAYAVNRLKEGKIYDIVELENLLTEAGIHLPELDNFIENNKDALVKTLLVKMKKGQKDTVDRTLRTLTKLNIAWPELAIIQKSIHADSNK